MRKQHSRFTYWLETLVIRLRDLLRPPSGVLLECGIKPGMTVLDFGCGPDGFSVAAATLVGTTGRVYAVDIQPGALRIVRCAAARRGLANLQAIAAGEIGRLPAASVDMALLYDVLHIQPEASQTGRMLETVHRLLKPAGVLSVRDHHILEARLKAMVTGGGLFRLLEAGSSGLQFEKVETSEESA